MSVSSAIPLREILHFTESKLKINNEFYSPCIQQNTINYNNQNLSQFISILPPDLFSPDIFPSLQINLSNEPKLQSYKPTYLLVTLSNELQNLGCKLWGFSNIPNRIKRKLAGKFKKEKLIRREESQIAPIDIFKPIKFYGRKKHPFFLKYTVFLWSYH